MLLMITDHLMKLLEPILVSLLFILLTVYFTNYFNNTLTFLHLNNNPELALFISSPFNMSTEGDPFYNLYAPAVLIFIFGIYLKNFNKAFQMKCSFIAILIMSILASYVTSTFAMFYYFGHADYGISLGTSIITISFITTFIISLMIYVERKEHFSHFYGHFMFTIILVLILALCFITAAVFLVTSSYLVHLIGFCAFLALFVPFYERQRNKIHSKKSIAGYPLRVRASSE
jgi:hypothetical protein